MKWIEQTLKGNTFSKIAPQTAKITLFSQKEYEYTREALKQAWSLTDEQLRLAEKSSLATDKATIAISFNTSKKESEQWFAKIVISPV